MSSRAVLTELLEQHYARSGWSPVQKPDGTVTARGIGGVTFIGLPVVAADLDDPSFPSRLEKLAHVRMPTGELCPLELLPEPACETALREILRELHLADRGHVEVYRAT